MTGRKRRICPGSGANGMSKEDQALRKIKKKRLEAAARVLTKSRNIANTTPKPPINFATSALQGGRANLSNLLTNPPGRQAILALTPDIF